MTESKKNERMVNDMDPKELRRYVETLLDALGVSRRYLGHSLAVDAVCKAFEDAQQLSCVRRGMLQSLAQQHQCSCTQVERNLRTVIHHAWQANEATIREMASYPMVQPPTVMEFIEILTVYALRR